MKTYSVDLRERLLRAIDAGLGAGEAARLFGVGPATIRRWRRRRELGTVAPMPKPGRTPKIAPADYPALAGQVADAPDATLVEHCAAWEARHGVRVSAATMCRLLRQLGLPLKKSRSSRPSGTRPPGRPGGARRSRSTRRPSSSSMRRARIRR